MFPAPPFPTFPAGQSTTAVMPLRFEDVTMDGRLIPLAIPPALGPLWREVVAPHAGVRNALATGILPILTRMTMVAHEHRVRADRPGQVYAGFVLAHHGESDDDRRLYFNAWAEVRAAGGKLSRHAEAGELVAAGTLFAEHTFTRPMAPPDQRRVARLHVEGYPEIPEVHYDAPAPRTAGDLPDGAHWLDELAPDPAEYAFTLDQTDSNQHVNSLVYVRIFLDAVNRRLAAAGRPLRVRSRAIDIAYRKPSFAGDRARAHVRLFEHERGIGAAGHIVGDDGKPRCYVRGLVGA
ncbi:MAG TPA: hypothetical protein VMJ10_00620 [Kofleriaceae bacterium]|nr:hypothetical protein [Kofleriaceae bacterium]